MNYQMIAFLIGRILLTGAAFMALPLLTALLYGESPTPFIITALVLLLAGLPFARRRPERTALYARDGFAVVAFAWLSLSVFGAVPFVLSGDIPSCIDAFFETVSGFTTTGSTILPEIEHLSRSGLFWRSFTHWIGGMGVLVFVMAILPLTDGHGMHLMRAEVPGPSVGKLVSRMSDSAKILYAIYLVLTIIEIGLLLAGGMPFFDACIHAFGTAGTGGFSNRNLSVGAYESAYFDVVIGFFMLLFGINFNLYYFLLIRRFRDAFASEELRVYLSLVAAAVAAIAVNIAPLYESAGTCLRHAFFQVASIITTTGFSSVDFNTWPSFSKSVLVVLMFIGACAGSTGGGIKISRILILGKSALANMQKMLHPNAVSTVRLEARPISETNLRGAYTYLVVYVLIFMISFLLLSLEGFDLVTTFTALAACINNIGPGLELVGPLGNFADFSPFAKLLLSFNMLLGRLEIFPMLLLFSPSIWRRRRIARHSADLMNAKTSPDARL